MKMIKWFFFFNVIALNAQVTSIELPQSNEKIKINSFKAIFSIYVDAKGTVYLEKDSIKIHNIGRQLSYLVYKLPIEMQHRVSTYLYMDKSVKYEQVDEIKTELASASIYSTYYKTNSIEDRDFLSGISWVNHLSFFRVKRLEKVLSEKEQEKNKRFSDSIAIEFGDLMPPPPPPPPPASWFFESQYKIYSDNQEAVSEALEGKEYQCITLTNEGYKTGSEFIKFENKEKIEKLFYSHDVVFVKFSNNLKYSKYLKTIIDFKALDPEKRAFFFELSKEIEEIHKMSKITLCN